MNTRGTKTSREPGRAFASTRARLCEHQGRAFASTSKTKALFLQGFTVPAFIEPSASCDPISLSSSSLQCASNPRSGPLLENGIGFESLIESSDETALGRLVICRQQEREQV
jgi:hypothetical protein